MVHISLDRDTNSRYIVCVDVARVSAAPSKPLLIFDGDCNFCRYWIARWRQITGDAIDYLPFQDASIAERFPELPRSRFEQAVQLIETDGVVYSGANAVFRSLAYGKRWPLWTYRHLPGVAPVSEALYGFVARNRTFFSWLTRILWGREAAPVNYVLVRWLFLRAMGLTYLIAFISLWTQIMGLVGHNGITPADEYMRALGQNMTGSIWHRVFTEPTLCWFRADDAFLNLHCAVGTVLSVLVLLGIAQKLSLFLLWIIYLSLTIVCGVFLSFQWDILLLESGLLAIIFAPTAFLPWREFAAPISKTGLWLLRWLLFRLMFESGCVKLLSGDVTWRNLTALNYHYETQPLPTWLGWHAHHLPTWWHTTDVVLMYVIEILVPFFIFMPRRLRLAAFVLFLLLQAGIAATGNYGFFNILTIALSLLLLDDGIILNRIPKTAGERVNSWLELRGGAPARPVLWKFVASSGRILKGTVVVLILVITSVQLLKMFRPFAEIPNWAASLYYRAAPFRSINEYGLFRVMTTNRFEIIVEGSSDGHNWLPYEFKWKPGDLKQAPGFVEPHMPRLDWQMWFLPFGSYRNPRNAWFIYFCDRLLHGTPEVTRLLQTNPFFKAPPQYIRATFYEYHFTDAATRKRDATWWRREFKGLYCPVLTLRGAALDGAPTLQLER